VVTRKNQRCSRIRPSTLGIYRESSDFHRGSLGEGNPPVRLGRKSENRELRTGNWV
jgi:hypothetical protein